MVNNNDEHSVEVREIMGEGANWMVRWGASVLVTIVVVMIGVFFLIKYPVFVTVPFPMEAATTKVGTGSVACEAVVSESVYAQIKAGQEVRVTVTARDDRAVIGRVDGKLADRRVRLVFPIEAGQQSKLRKTLQGAGSAKIKIGEKRLISQFKGIFLPK